MQLFQGYFNHRRNRHQRSIKNTLIVLVAIVLLGLTSTQSVKAAIVSEDAQAEGSTGRLRYFYDDAVSSRNACENLVLLGVGTAMRTSEYDELLSGMVQDQPTVAVMVDQNPFWFVKTNSRRFATFSNAIVDQLSDIVPACRSAPQRIVVGGHSAGGQAAWDAVAAELYSFEVAGFLGLDPFRLDPNDRSDVPALLWGFTKTTCQVTASNAAKAGYQATSNTNRVFYQIDNASNDAGHCSFTDNGCVGPICPAPEESSTFVRESVSDSTQRFLAAIANREWDKESFQLGGENDNDNDKDDIKLNLFVNQDTVRRLVRRTRYLRA